MAIVRGSALVDAMAWIENVLTGKGGKEMASVMRKEARERGISQGTLYRAATKLGVSSKKTAKFDSDYIWSLKQ